MHATKAAVEEGIEAGGGVALLRCTKTLEGLAKKTENEDQAMGVRIVKRALEEPLRQIADNAGHEGAVVVNKVKELESDHGFNAQQEKYHDLVKAGIIDPTKVVRSAVQNAASIAGLMLTTEALVSEIPDEDKKSVGGGGDMGGGMGGGMGGMGGF